MHVYGAEPVNICKYSGPYPDFTGVVSWMWTVYTFVPDILLSKAHIAYWPVVEDVEPIGMLMLCDVG